MRRSALDPSVLADPGWWHWAATVPLLAAHLAGARGAVEAALALCAAAAVYSVRRVGHWRPVPAQVRVAYFGWLSLGLLPWMGWMHVVALVGTTAMVVVGYCPLARVLGLLWFNRSEPLSGRLVWRQVVAAPAGGLFDVGWAADRGPAACSFTGGPAR